MDAQNDRQHHTEAETDVVDETRHFAEIADFMRFRINEIQNASYQSGQNENAED